MSDIDIAAKDRRVRPCVAPCGEESSASGKQNLQRKRAVCGRFSPDLAENGRRYENKQEKARGCLASPSQETADGNADRIRLCRAFKDNNKNCDLGVAVFERKIRQEKEMI